MKKKLLFPFLWMIFILPFSMSLHAQNPTYLCELRNDVQVSSTVFEFDIYLLQTGGTSFEYAAGQFGILINPAVKNGGTITATILAGSSDPTLVATNQNPISINFLDASSCVRIAGRVPPGSGFGAIISATSPGTKICRVRLTNTVPFAQFQPNLTWTTNLIYPTIVNAYVAGLNTNITVYASHTTSNLANLTMNQSTWNGAVSNDWSTAGNWSAGIPLATTGVIIPAAMPNMPIVNTDPLTPATCNTLTINTGATLTIAAGKALTATGATTNNGTFTIASDATGTGSFIDNGTITGTGVFHAMNYLTGAGGATPNGRYWYISTPIPSATSLVFAASGPNRLWSYSEAPTQGYTEILTDAVNLNPLQGYVARLGATTTIDFTGTTLNTGNYGSAGNLTRSAVSVYDGFNLVSNPFPSAIDFGVAGTGLTRTNLDNTIWFRSAGNFSTYNWSTGIGIPVTTTQYIPAMQSFWVLVSAGQTNGTLMVNNTARVHNSQTFYKKLTATNVFRMEAHRDGFSDEAVVCFFPSALESYENYDSQKMFSPDIDYPQIYTLTSDNINVAINGESLLSASEDRVVNVGFKTNIAGQHSIIATNLTEFDPSISVYLEDTQLSTMQDMRANNTYTFSSSATDDISRFKLHFGLLTTGINTIENESASIYSADNTIYVNVKNNINGTIEVIDMLGKKIISQPATQGLNILQPNVDPGIYIVKVQNNNLITTQKITLSK